MMKFYVIPDRGANRIVPPVEQNSKKLPHSGLSWGVPGLKKIKYMTFCSF